MNRGSGFVVRVPSVFLSTNEWISTDEFQIGGQANTLRVWISCSSSDAGELYMRLLVKDGLLGDYYQIDNGALLGPTPMIAGEKRAIQIPLVAMMQHDYAMLQFRCSDGAGSAVIGISITDYCCQPIGYVPLIDRVSGVQVGMDITHDHIHDGEHYYIKNWYDITGLGTVKYFGFKTSAGPKRAHVRTIFRAEDEFTVSIYEDCTYLDIGTLIPSANNDRDSSKTSEMLAYADPVPDVLGISPWSTAIGNRGQAGLSPILSYEIVAKTDCYYIFEITKINAGTHYIDIDFFWYESASKMDYF